MAKTTKKDKPLNILILFLFILLILFPLGQFTTIPLGIFGLVDIHIYLQDIVLIGIWFILIYLFSWDKIKLSQIPFFKPILLFILMAFLSLIFNLSKLPFSQFIISSLYLIRWIGYLGVYFASYLIILRQPQLKEKIYFGLIMAAFVSSIFGLLQYFLYPDLRNLYYLGWDPHYYRVFGTFLDPSFLGLIFVLALNLIYLQIFTKPRSYWLMGIAGVIYIALALTYSRSSYIAFALSMAFICYQKRAWKYFFALIFIGLVTLKLLPNPTHSEGAHLGRSTSSEARIGSWQDSLSLIRKSPLFGLGFNALRYTNPTNTQYFANNPIPSHASSGIENSFLFVWVTTGLIGLISFVYLLGKIFIMGDEIVKVSLLAICLHSIFNNSLFYPWIMFWLWLILGLGLARRVKKF